MGAQDERVVLTAELRDELSGPLSRMKKNVSDTEGAVGKANKNNASSTQAAMGSIGSAMDGAGKKSSALGRAFQSVGAGVSAVGGALWGGAKKVAEFGAKGALAIGAVGLAVGALAVKGGISRQLQIEEATAKMIGLGNSTKTVDAVMKDALSSVKGTAFGMGEAATVASTALASGIKPGKEMASYLTLVADASTIAGTGMQDMGSIMGKVTNSGKVTNDVLNQFGDRGVGVLQMLSKEYGVTAEEMTKMVSKGQVDAATFEKVLRQNIGGAALKSGNTTQGAFKNMGAALSRIGVTLTSWFFPVLKVGFGAVTTILDAFNGHIKPVGESFGKWFQGRAVKAIESFTVKAIAGMDKVEGGIVAFAEAWKANDGVVTATGFGGVLERAAYYTHQLVGYAQQLDFSSFSGFMNSLGGGSAGMKDAFGSIGDSLKKLSPAFQAFRDQLPNIGGAVATLAGAGLTLLVNVLGFLADHVDTIIKWMPAIVAGFIAWRLASGGLSVAQLAVNAAQVAMVPLTTVNNLLRMRAIGLEREHAFAMGTRTAAMNITNGSIIRSTATMVAHRVVMMASAAATWVATSASTAFAIATNAAVWPIALVVIAIAALVAGFIWAYNNVGWFKDGVDAAIAGVVIIFQNLVSFFQTNMMPVISAVVLFFVTAWQIAAPLIAAVIDFIITVFMAIVNFWVTILGPAINVVVAYFQFGFALIQAAVSLAIAVVMVIVNGLVNFFNGVLVPAAQVAVSWFKDKLGPAFTVAGTAARIIGDKIKQFLTPVIDALTPIVGGAVDALGGLASFLSDTLAGAASGIADIFNGIAGAIQGATDAVKDFASNPLGAIGKVFGIGNSGGGSYAGGGVLHAAKGAIVGGYSPGKDTVPAMLSPGESVLVPELTRALGPDNIMAWNSWASSGRKAGGGPGRSAAGSPMTSGGGGSSSTTIVKIEKGAFQIDVHADSSGKVDIDDLESQIDAIFRKHERRGY